MMNYIALYFTHYLVIGLEGPLSAGDQAGVGISQVCGFSRQPGRTLVFVALAMAGVVYYILWRTT